MSITITSSFSGVASITTRSTLVDSVLAHGVTVTFNRVVIHGSARFSTTLGSGVVLASRSSSTGFSSLGEVAAEQFTLVGRVDTAHTEISAALSSLGISGVNHDLVTGSLTNSLRRVPHTARISFAVILGGVDKSALSLANHLGGVPDAVGVESTLLGVTNVGTNLRALTTIPLTLRIRLAGIFRTASATSNSAGSSDRLLTVKARVTVGDELTLSFTAITRVRPLASRRFFTFTLVAGNRAVGTALTRDDVPLALAVHITVAIEGITVLELATRLTTARGSIVFTERLVTTLSSRESGAVSLTRASTSGRSDEGTARGSLARTSSAVRTVRRTSLIALAVDEGTVSLSSTSGLVINSTTHFSTGVTNEFTIDRGRAVGLSSVAATLDAGSSGVLAHVVGSTGLSRSDGRAGFLTSLISFRPHTFSISITLGLRSVAISALLSTLVVGINQALFISTAVSERSLERTLARAHVGGDVPLADGDVQATDTIRLLFAGSCTDTTRVVEGTAEVSIALGFVSTVHLETSFTALLLGFVVLAHVGFKSALGRRELTTRSLASLSGLIPHAFTRNSTAASSVGVLLDTRSAARSTDNNTVGVRLAISCSAALAVLLALTFSSRPLAAGVSVTSSLIREVGSTRLGALGSRLVPTADRISLARIDGKELVTRRIAHGAINRPSTGTVKSTVTGRLRGEAELTLGLAVVADHLTHTLVEAVSGIRLVRDTRVNTLLLGSIPHATVVSVTASSSRVSSTTLGTTRLGDITPAALFRSRALRDGGKSGAERLTASSVGVELTVRTSITITLASSILTGSSTSRTSPDTSVVSVAAALVVMSELALSGALTTRPHAHSISLAGRFRRSTATGSTAFTSISIPHTRISVLASILS